MKYITKSFMTIILITFLSGIVSCSERKQKEVKIPGVPPGYFEKWEYFTVDSEVVKEKAKEFFGGREYKAIWKWDTDGDGKIDYLLIEPHPKIVKGIKGGILIGEDGEVKLIIDRNKGFYTPEYIVEDFEREGIRNGEVECIRFLFYPEEHVKFTKKDKEYFNRIPVVFGVIGYQLIDKDLKLIDLSTWWVNKIAKVYDPQKNKVSYEIELLFAPYPEPKEKEDIYNEAKEAIKIYRLNKSKGIVFDPVNFDPENPEEVKKYIQSLKEKK